MRNLVAAIYADCFPFNNLPNTSFLGSVQHQDELKEGDILIVHGGSDISPSLYNKRPSLHTRAYEEPSTRDSIEWNLMLRARELEIPIIGICRGAQMLCALAGGFLVQHVNGHGSSHEVKTKDRTTFMTNSIHHQMMYPWVDGVKFDLIGWSKTKLSNVYFDEDNLIEVPVEPEYIFFPEVKGFAVQWHPEIMGKDTVATKYILSHIQKELKL